MVLGVKVVQWQMVRLLHRYGHGVVCNGNGVKSKGLWWYCVVSKGDTAVGGKSLPSARFLE
jgi:hypothetical protein